MMSFLLVALGGAIGAAGRYGVSLAMPMRPDGWPWATFGINVLGSLMIGVLSGWLAAREGAGEAWRLFLGVGVAGGFTTFSAYSLETLALIGRGAWLGAFVYALGSVAAGLAAAAAGAWIARGMAA
jgi:CrcB protein